MCEVNEVNVPRICYRMCVVCGVSLGVVGGIIWKIKYLVIRIIVVLFQTTLWYDLDPHKHIMLLG